MKILWHSNSPWAQTGYGQQSALFGPRLAHLGHDVAFSAYWGLAGAMLDWCGFPVYPADEKWGNHLLPAYAAAHGEGDPAACQVITLMDVWVLTAPTLNDLRIGAWCPVDHDPIPPRVLDFFKRSTAVPIAMSEFGQTKMREAGLDPLYVPHGVDTTVFAPHDQREIRESIGIPADAFVVGMFANNKGTAPPRKAFPQAFEAFKRLRDKNPDAVLYLHTEKFGVHEGMNLVALAEFVGIPAEAIYWTPQFEMEVGIPQPAMAMLYSAIDVLLSPSYGEGFGIPVIEAQACGRPVIVSDFSAQPELCGAGWTIGGERWYDASQGAFFLCPSIADITEALEDAYDKAAGLREHARKFALGYDADRVLIEHWVPALAALEQRAAKAKLSTVKSRPRKKKAARR